MMASEQRGQRDYTAVRIQFFEETFGPIALRLACHAAFPLTLTSDLVYCLRENFLPECPWYHSADLLLSGLCNTVGYDLYEMERDTQLALLARLKKDIGEQRICDLQNFMVAYIQAQLDASSVHIRQWQDRPHWTALACLKPDEAFHVIQQELQQIALEGNVQDRFLLAALTERYADLFEEEYRPFLLDWSQNIVDNQPLQNTADVIKACKAAGFPTIQRVKVQVAFVSSEKETTDDPGDILHSGECETVFVDQRGQITQRKICTFHFYNEPLDENVPPLEMIAIPGGQFEMGSPNKESGRWDTEDPIHLVSVSPFFMGRSAVTQAQWCVVANWEGVNQDLNPNPSYFKGDQRPVEYITWEDAIEFCERLSCHTGREYRLPTEAEWEYACRAGTKTPFHFGETLTPDLAKYNSTFSYANGPTAEYQQQTTEVGRFRANAFGLYDMHGNVWEWCLDTWHKNYEGAPTDGREWIENNNDSHVVRGGSWVDSPKSCRCAYRSGLHTTITSYDQGFRVVCCV